MGRNLVDRLEENSLAFPEAATVQAAMVTAWFFMLRAKEYCNSNGVDEDIVLRGIDARFTKDAEVVEGKDANELTMQFRKTKTDQLGFGESKTLKATGEHHICPVEALVRMQRAWPTRFMKERGDSVRHLFRWANGVVLKRVEAQELRRRDRNFVPMSVASELLAKQLQLTEEKAAESTRHAATARLFASRSLAACLAATLAPKVATSLQQALDALRVLRASERACSASLRRLSFVLRNAALRSLHLGLVAFARTGACPCCQRLAFLCRAVEKGRSARGAAKQQVAVKMSHHVFTGVGGQRVLQADKPLCFLLDEKKDPNAEEKKGKKKKNAKDQAPSFKNFGALLNLGKLKGAQRWSLAGG
eukprot:g19745.t1